MNKNKELKDEVRRLLFEKVEEMNDLAEEVKDDLYSNEELQEIIDNWGEHEI